MTPTTTGPEHAIHKRTTFYTRDQRDLPASTIVEADGAIVEITVGLNDADGRQVTRVDVTVEDEQRGGDRNGHMWRRDGARLVRLNLDETSLPGVHPPHPPLTLDTVHLLSRLANAVMHNRSVRFIPDGTDDDVRGTLRHIVKPDSIALLPGNADPRDGRVRITIDLGSEIFLPVTDVLDRMARAEFGIED